MSNHDNKKRGSALEPLLHSEHIVTIEKLVVGGDGLARLQYQDKNLVVFVPRSAPQDKLKIQITEVGKNHLSGRILQIVEASPQRQKAPCAYYDDCGGCSWQHVSENEQIHQKSLILDDLLKKFLPDIPYKFEPVVKSESNFRYRNRIQLKQLNKKFGYFQKSSHNIVDIDDCLLAETAIAEKIPDLKAKLRPTQEIKKFELRINHLNQFEYYPIGEDGEGLSFSQVNNSVNEKLVAQTLALIAQKPPSFLTELYAGAGNFTFPLLQKFGDLRIESVELNAKLTSFTAKKLTELRLQKRLFSFTTDCESFVERRTLSNEMVLLDPPRSGCSPSVLKKIMEAAPEKIIYISCHPVFLARDLKTFFAGTNAYRIEYLQIFDMFPQTDHFETLILLSKS